jgi:hypothetical protein
MAVIGRANPARDSRGSDQLQPRSRKMTSKTGSGMPSNQRRTNGIRPLTDLSFLGIFIKRKNYSC